MSSKPEMLDTLRTYTGYMLLCASLLMSTWGYTQCANTTANGYQENLLQATFHSALYKTADGYAASGSSTAPDGSAQPNIQLITNANGYTGIPATTSIAWGTIGGNAQIILIGDDGIMYAGGDEGVVLDESITTSAGYGPIGLALPGGVGIGDIHKFQATNEVLMIQTVDGQIFITGKSTNNIMTPSVNTEWNLLSMPLGVSAIMVDISAKTILVYGSDGNFYTRGARIFTGIGTPSIDMTGSWITMVPPPLSPGSTPVQVELANHEHYNQIGYLILDADGSIHSMGDAPVVANNSNSSFAWTKVGLNCPNGELNNVVYLSASDNDNRHVGAGAILEDNTIMLWGVDDFNMLAGADSECPSEICNGVGSDMSSILYIENGTHLTPAINAAGQLCNVGHNSEGGFGDGTTDNRSCYECYAVPSLPDLCIDGSCDLDSTITVSICNGESYTNQGSEYTETGTYTETFTTSGGCDSVLTIALTVLASDEINNEVTICQGQTYYEGASEYTSAGVYEDSYINSAGCDSVVITTLSVEGFISYTNAVDICEGESHTEGASVYSQEGVYEDSYTSSGGCDSIVSTILSVHQNYAQTNEVSICSGQTYVEGSSSYSSAGSYEDVYQSAFGCDSIVTTVLSVLDQLASTQEVSICEGSSFAEQGSVYTESGTYYNTYVTESGCDSIVTTELTVLDYLSSTQEISICDGTSHTEQASVYTESGTYYESYVTASGCDSIVTTILEVLPSITSSSEVIICAGDVYVVGESSYAQAGEYTDVLQSAEGCDSLVTTSLTVSSLPSVYLAIEDIISCEPVHINLENSVYPGDDWLYTWDLGDGSTSSEVSLTHLYDEEGVYSISLTLSNGICTAVLEEPLTITISERPIADFSASTWETELGSSPIDFFDESVGSIISNQWSFGDGGADEGNSVSHLFQEIGTYLVTLAVTNEAGCTDTIIKSVEVDRNGFDILVPNAFIPDPNGPSDGSFNINSGRNSIFFPYSENAVGLEFYVFNRWGEQVFKSTTLTKGWDGYFQGKPCPLAVYSYRVLFSYPGGEQKEKLGTVTLFR